MAKSIKIQVFVYFLLLTDLTDLSVFCLISKNNFCIKSTDKQCLGKLSQLIKHRVTFLIAYILHSTRLSA